MNRDLIYFNHIINSIEKIEKAINGKNKRKFFDSGILKDGVLYNLQTMSESTQKISKSFKLNAPEIPWSNISSFRNKLVHDYLGIDDEIVWNIIKKELPKLKKRIQKIIDFLEQKNNN